MAKKDILKELEERRVKRIEEEMMVLQTNKIEHIQLLIQLSFQELYDIERNIGDAHEHAEKKKDNLRSELLWEKYRQVQEAIEVKNGNEEEIWDFLT